MRAIEWCAAVLVVSTTLLPGCGKRQTGIYKTSTRLPGGRIVSMTTDSTRPQWNLQAKPGPTMHVSDKLIVLLPQQVVVNGQPAADIPADTRQIKIVDSNGAVEITADDTLIYHFRR